MNRRAFLAAGLAAAAGRKALGEGLVNVNRRYEIRRPGPGDRIVTGLEAVVAARLPDSCAVVETPTGSLRGASLQNGAFPPLLELREYLEASPALLAILRDALARAGAAPWLRGRSCLLIPFESLQQRERVWRELGAGCAWGAYTFAIYRPAPVFGSA